MKEDSYTNYYRNGSGDHRYCEGMTGNGYCFEKLSGANIGGLGFGYLSFFSIDNKHGGYGDGMMDLFGNQDSKSTKSCPVRFTRHG